MPKPLPISTAASASTPTPTQNAPPTPTGLRAQLNHLRPRHAYFRAEVFVHQISSVPYVNAEFSLKWRFKNAQMPRVGLLERVKRGRSTQSENANVGEEESERRDSTSTGVESIEDRELGYAPTASNSNSIPSTTSDGFLSVPPSVASSRQVSSSSASSATRPSISQSSSYSSTPTAPIMQPSSSSSSSSSQSPPSLYSTPLASLSRATISLPPAQSAFPSLPTTYTPTPAKGTTPFLPLKDHSIAWNLPLDTVLKMDVDRDTHQLQPSPFKLVVVQKEEEGGPRVQNPRLGAVYLNLAEYVDKGRVERRYLLRESRTNATFKLSIVLTPLSSPSHPIPTYIAPALPKGEILTGIASFLESDTYKRFQRPRELELYGPYRDQEELEIDLMGGLRSRRWEDDEDGSDYSSCEDYDDDLDDEEEEEEYQVPFDPARLPIAYGIKTTETLIDALFNPEVVYNPQDECPFTRYVDPVVYPPPKKPREREREKRRRKKGSESVYSGSTESSASGGSKEGKGGAGVSVNGTGGVKAWFRRIGGSASSRPGTPTGETFASMPVSEDGILRKDELKKPGHAQNNSLSHGLGIVLSPSAGGGGVGGIGGLGFGSNPTISRPSTPVLVVGTAGAPGVGRRTSTKRPTTPRLDSSGSKSVRVPLRV